MTKIEKEINKVKEIIARGKRHLKGAETNKAYRSEDIESLKENVTYHSGYLDGLKFLEKQKEIK